MILKLILLSFVFIMTACSQVSLMNIKSSPEKTQVYARATGSKDRVLLGETPIKVDSTKVREKIKTQGLIILEIEKEDYHPAQVYLIQGGSQEIDLNFNLEKLPKIEQGHKVDLIVQELFECQKYLKVKRFDDCQKIITDLKKKYPEVSSIYEFEGSLFYLKNEKNKALQAFLTALKYNDKNEEARRMIRIIKNQ